MSQYTTGRIGNNSKGVQFAAAESHTIFVITTIYKCNFIHSLLSRNYFEFFCGALCYLITIASDEAHEQNSRSYFSLVMTRSSRRLGQG